jgi:glutathione peroxidase
MTLKERILKTLYPLIMKFSRNTSKGTCMHNSDMIPPNQSIYDLSVDLNTGKNLALNSFRGKKILLVNTASECGFTRQFEALQKLHNENSDIVIIGFPSAEFKGQEKDSDQDIAAFCQINYGVTFPFAKKSNVLIKKDQNTIYKWLTQSDLNGWNNHQPDWNFSKFLINEKGILTHYFGPSISPMDSEIQLALKTE